MRIYLLLIQDYNEETKVVTRAQEAITEFDWNNAPADLIRAKMHRVEERLENEIRKNTHPVP